MLKTVVPKNCVWVFLLLCLFVHSYESLSSEFEPGGKPEIKLINPDAEAIIGAVVNVREHGAGLFGCGSRLLEGVVTVDALAWAVDEVNRKLWSGSSPNVSLGLHVMDSCSRTRIAASQIADFLPELMGEVQAPVGAERGLKLGVIDAAELGSDEDVAKSLDDVGLALVDFPSWQVAAPQEVARAALSFAQELRWDRVAVFHSGSSYSLQVLKAFTKGLKKAELCVPWILNVEDFGLDDHDELEEVIEANIPIIALLPSEEHDLFLSNIGNTSQKIPVLLTDLVFRGNLVHAPTSKVKLYSMLLLPDREVRFEEFYARRSVMTGVRTEDELGMVERTRVARRARHVVGRISEALGTPLRELCPGGPGETRLCPDLWSSDGRRALSQLLDEQSYSAGKLFELVHYQFQFPNGHVHLHKVMAHTDHGNLDVFEPSLPLMDTSCEGRGEKRSRRCRCLEAKSVRSEGARNIGQNGRKKELDKHRTEAEYIYSQPDIRPVPHPSLHPSVYTALRDPWNASLGGVTLLGAFLTLLTAQYFATSAALPRGGLTSGTSVLGYLILIGLFMLYSANLSFVLTPSVSTCAARRFLPSCCYAVIFSAMMIKVWASWRLTCSEKPDTCRPGRLALLSLAFSSLQLGVGGAWLILVPPRSHLEGAESPRWACYPSADLDSHLLVSMVYVVGLLFVTAVLGIRTCSLGNNNEARWILISSALSAIVFSAWGVSVATGICPAHRTAATNLVVATILLLCLYVPKIRLHNQLKRSQPEIAQYPVDLDKEYPLFAARNAFPVVLDYGLGSGNVSTEPTESGYSNPALSIDGGTESMSIPFEIETSSYSEPDHEPFTFSTFLDEPTSPPTNDPTQVVPSSLYPLDMFSTDLDEPPSSDDDHCRPGTNEFTPTHRSSSQMYLCPAPEWVP